MFVSGDASIKLVLSYRCLLFTRTELKILDFWFTCDFIAFKIVSFGMLFFLAISIIDPNLEFVAGFGSLSSEKK